uniref:mTERF n=1 Tax=Oryza meridionalis TaxID=40149 RepID=A0A0E0F492_9ORYZ
MLRCEHKNPTTTKKPLLPPTRRRRRRRRRGAMLHLRNHLLPLLHAASSSSSPLHLTRHRLLSTAARSPFSVEHYLVATCGLTAAHARRASPKLSRLNSASNPDAVLALLSSTGGLSLSRADLAAVVAAEPRLLRARPGTIARRIASLLGAAGLSAPQVGRLLLSGGAAHLAASSDVSPKLAFWVPFLGSFDMFLKILRRCNAILATDVDKVVRPNVALLGECGLGVCDIVQMTQTAAWLLTFNPERLKVVVRRAEELGVPTSSWAFKDAVCTVARNNEGTIAARMEFLRGTLGCSMDKLRSAISRKPSILGFSEKTLRGKIEFLLTKVQLEPEYILQRPVMLTLSLDKRLAPRHYVLQALVEKGLIKNDVDYYSCVCFGNEHFVARYIDRHEDALPGLTDAYAAVHAGKSPAQSLTQHLQTDRYRSDGEATYLLGNQPVRMEDK